MRRKVTAVVLAGTHPDRAWNRWTSLSNRVATHVYVPSVAARWNRKKMQRGLLYPTWIPLVSEVLLAAAAIASLAQRSDVGSRWLLGAAVMLLVTGPGLAQLFMERWVPWWATAVGATAATWLLLAQTGGVLGPTDPAVAITIIAVPKVACTDGVWRAAVFAVGGAAVLVSSTERESRGSEWVFVMEVMLGLLAGAMLHAQMRALVAERNSRQSDGQAAMLGERQRLAREVHDLVAHSLSISMLHVAGARQALVTDNDTEDAIAALADAETVGRRAMEELRRTVRVVQADTSTHFHPLPGGEGLTQDLVSLVEGVRAAGMVVDFRVNASLDELPAPMGLAVYRIVQESLTNAAKHAAGRDVVVGLHDKGRELHLLIENPTTPGTRAGVPGLGLKGMSARAEQLGGRLTAGVSPTSAGVWTVRGCLPRA